jgi:hypothetical protein
MKCFIDVTIAFSVKYRNATFDSQNFCGLSRCLDVQPISWSKVEVATHLATRWVNPDEFPIEELFAIARRA